METAIFFVTMAAYTQKTYEDEPTMHAQNHWEVGREQCLVLEFSETRSGSLINDGNENHTNSDVQRSNRKEWGLSSGNDAGEKEGRKPRISSCCLCKS